MNSEDDEFNRIEREASMRKAAVVVAITKREWVGLTDEEIDDIYQGVGRNDLMLVREVEAKLKEKNT
jgi:hypothetical protein